MEEPGNQVRSAGIKAHQVLEHREQHQAVPALGRDARQGAFGKIRPGGGLSGHWVYTWQKPLRCSGGRKAGTVFARAVIMNSEAVLADEPAATLDSANRPRIIALLFGLNCDSESTIVTVTHDASLNDQHDRIIKLQRKA